MTNQPGNNLSRSGEYRDPLQYWTLRVSRKDFFFYICANMTNTDYNGVLLDPLILPPTTTPIAGTVTRSIGGEYAQLMSGLAATISQAGVVTGSDVTDQAGNYYIPDLVGGKYLEEIRDPANILMTSKNIGVLSDQGTNFIEFFIDVRATVPIIITSTPVGQPFAADGLCSTTPHTFQWVFGHRHDVALPTFAAVHGSFAQQYAFSGWADGGSASIPYIAVGSVGAIHSAWFASQPAPVTPPAAGSGIRITSPPAGTAVRPGDTVSVVIQPDPGITLQKAVAWIPPVSSVPTVLQAAPFQTSVNVPTGVLGAARVQAYAIDTTNTVWQRSLNIYIESSLQPTSLKVDPWLAAMPVSGLQTHMQITAVYPDTSTGTVTNSSYVALASANNKVATIDAIGNMVVVAPGSCSVCARHRGLVATLPVTVGVFSMPGGLDGDGDVDQDDLNLMLKALNTAATGAGDPRALNKDGKIDALDTRTLTTWCTAQQNRPIYASTFMPMRTALLTAIALLVTLPGVGTANQVQLGFLPSSQTVPVGGDFQIALGISLHNIGGPRSLGAYDLNVLFDPTLLSFSSVTFGDPVLGDQLDLFGLGNIQRFTPGSGNVNLFEFSLDSSGDLDLFQARDFTLFTLKFSAIGAGAGAVDLNFKALSDASGVAIEALIQNGTVTAVDTAPVPEPGTWVLLAMGAALLVGTARRLHKTRKW